MINEYPGCSLRIQTAQNQAVNLWSLACIYISTIVLSDETYQATYQSLTVGPLCDHAFSQHNVL
jgi:hypothetical protein